jgi:hypothetical protein
MPDTDHLPEPAAKPDYDRLLRANLERVFNERDATKRAQAITELFVDNPVMYEPAAVVEGREAISAVAGKLLEEFGPTFRFTPQELAVGHHGLGTLRWTAGPDGSPPVVTGMDAAEITGGRITRLWVLLNPPAA